VTAEDNKALLEGYLREVWMEGNPDAIGDYVAPHYQRHMSPTAPPLDPATQVERIKGIKAAFPDVSIVAEEMIADENFVAFRSTLRGTHQGEILGIAPTGKEVEVGLVDFIRIEDGKFVEQWGGPDMLDMAKQLGATITAGE
jgi:hypothetical protein